MKKQEKQVIIDELQKLDAEVDKMWDEAKVSPAYIIGFMQNRLQLILTELKNND